MKNYFHKFQGRLKSPVFIITLITLVSLFVRGYGFGLGDQVLHVPLLNKLKDPSLFTKDYLFPLLDTHVTPTYSINLLIEQIYSSNFFISNSILYFITLWLFYYGIYLLSGYVFKNKSVGILSCILFVIPLPVAGAAVDTIEYLFVPRMLSITIILYTIKFIFEKKNNLTFIALSLAYFTHPISGIHYLILLLPPIIYLNLTNIKAVLIRSSLLIAVISVLALSVLPRNDLFVNQNLSIGSHWLNILHLRNTYAFPLKWKAWSWFFLILSLIPLISHIIYSVFLKKHLSKVERIMLIILSTCMVLLLIQIVFTSKFPNVFIISLQLGRVWILPILFSFMFLANFIYKLINKKIILKRSLYIFIILFFMFYSFSRNNYSNVKSQPQDWINAQVWANQHTSTSCTFLVDFYSQGFRVYSRRAIVGEYKDGTLSFYSEQFGLIWDKKRQFFSREKRNAFINNLDEINKIQQYSFVVANNKLPVPLDKIYSNAVYSIYKMDNLESDCVYI